MLDILKDDTFKITINGGKTIGFRHPTYDTTIRVVMPTCISSNSAKILVDSISGYEIDPTTVSNNDTDDGNWIQYNCELYFQENLPTKYDEKDDRCKIDYPVQILYDGLKSPIIQYRIGAWHYLIYNIDVNNSEATYSQDTVSFIFIINPVDNDFSYAFEPIIEPFGKSFDLDQCSQNQYKCKVYNLSEGFNSIEIKIKEKDMPPVSRIIEIPYTKSAAKTKQEIKVIKPEIDWE